ncbi:MAG TPA: glycosyltransferase family 4 protein [Blastocatellia bacterium]|jgi:glycosyltransferase involved in cell wall biosynthesis|nr:glycosyltransferase family 4 protein [Blastocatellia bacterium]
MASAESDCPRLDPPSGLSPVTCLFIVPGDPERLTGGSIYNLRSLVYLRARGCRVDVLSVPDLSYFAALFLGVLLTPWLLARLARGKYGLVIQDSWAHPSLLAFNLACRAARGIRMVRIVHQLRWMERGNRISKAVASRVERASLASSDLIITVSDFMRRGTEALLGGGSKIDIIVAAPGCDRQNGTPAAPSPHARQGEGSGPDSPVRLLFVGNCTRRKGLHHLIDAMASLTDVRVALDVVGDCAFEPAYYRELRRAVADKGLQDMVSFHGRVSDELLKQFYCDAQIFVLPSSYEGFGIVCAEAMGAGLPVIASSHGPAREIVSENENALLAPPGDPRALAGLIRELATDPGMRARFGRRSRELSKTLPTWQSTTATVYRSLLALLEE